MQQEEVAYDLAKFPPLFKKIKTPEIFQGNLENGIFDASKEESSGTKHVEYPADLNYYCPIEIKVATFSLNSEKHLTLLN